MEAATHRITIDEPDADTRLDVFLAVRFEQISRARWQRAIEDELISINTRAAKSSYKLRVGDVIDIEIEEVLAANLAYRIEPEAAPLDIVYEDAEVVVINKPAGLVVHPGAGQLHGTLVNRLVFHFQNLAGQTDQANIRPGIVHRLDADTSGLIIVAKNDFAHEHLSKQFRERSIEKRYVALVHGVVRDEAGKIEQPVGRDARNRTRMTIVPPGRGGREAVTVYKVSQRFDRFTLLDVNLKTGRTHQIRVHLAHLKHPLVGDETYNAGRDNQIADARLRQQIKTLNRHFLHAARLSFNHPTRDERLRFEAALPDELAAVLANLT